MCVEVVSRAVRIVIQSLCVILPWVVCKGWSGEIIVVSSV